MLEKLRHKGCKLHLLQDNPQDCWFKRAQWVIFYSWWLSKRNLLYGETESDNANLDLDLYFTLCYI